jgi:K+-sensing histidine kinase KdpD
MTVSQSQEPTDRREAGSSVEPAMALVLGPLAVLLLAGVLAPVRDDIGTTNIALAMTTIVVLAALSSRLAGAATAVMAALSFNFFHTQPYQSLRIHSGRDVVTVALLMTTGLLVSEISAWRRRAIRASRRHVEGESALERAAAMLAAGSSADEMWTQISTALTHVLHITACRFEPGASSAYPIIERSGSLATKSHTWNESGFELPPGGAAIPVVYGGSTLGHVVVEHRQGAGSMLDERRVCVALADLYAVALTRSNAGRS